MLFCIGACQVLSYKDTKIKGTAFLQNDQFQLSGYEIHLVETETPTRPFASINRTILATEITDESGKFDFGEIELSKRSRFEYTAEFERNATWFLASQSWQEGQYSPVKERIKIDVGKDNQLDFNMVGFGKIIFSFTNQSINSEIRVDVNLLNNGNSNPSGSHLINQSETVNSSISALAGPSVVEFIVLDGNGNPIDTILEEADVPFKESVNVNFIYN